MSAEPRRARPRALAAGKPYPLGATWDGAGANFAIFSEHATGMQLCLFDEDGSERTRLRMPQRTAHVWHGYLDGMRAGQVYGYRVEGPYRPEDGHRFNPAKLLLDPYAKAMCGHLDWSGPIRGSDPRSERGDLSLDDEDSAPSVPKAVVVDTAFDWSGEVLPEIPWNQTVIYETHVRGLTHLHPLVPDALRGRYLGVCHPTVIAHLRELGVTAVELLPVQAFLDEEFLIDKGLRNYWGYNTIGFFAPDARYATSEDPHDHLNEFKTMVKTLHANGLEVILDVVYNHTAEGNHLGPTLAFRGIDNASYYRLFPGQPRFYVDVTGTGNTLNARHPYVLQLLMDSLRYWVQEMHVDGFRFDLTPALARDPYDVDPRGAFFRAVHQDPALARVKLIAEPWDIGDGGYQAGKFPVRWSEWNDRFRDTTRAFWRGDAGRGAELALRLSGSSDLYGAAGRAPQASINFITAHDGFTLEDLVSYHRKHNEANLEENRDGSDYNLSTNHGHEGPTADRSLLAIRDRHKRNFLAMLLLALGVPMIGGGDELGRTQLGNNNAYCQDNETSWYSWELDDRDRELLTYCQRLIRLRHDLPILHRNRFFDVADDLTGSRELAWFRPDGAEMTETDWQSPHVQAFTMQMCGDDHGTTIGESLAILINASPRAVDFRLPTARSGSDAEWLLLLDTVAWETPTGRTCQSGATVRLPDRSLQVYCRREADEVETTTSDR